MTLKFQSHCDRWLFCGVVLLAVLTVPQMLCLPLTADTEHYDVQAHCALNGGVLYRDVLEPNLPGVVWVHMLVRSVAGWSSEVMRAFDLIVLLAIGVLLSKCLGISMRGEGAMHAGLVMLFLWWCYVSLPEWCHCQRDLWMLLPALGALTLRQARRGACDVDKPAHSYTSAIVLEGFLWGIAFWLKPFIAVPVICVCAVSGWLEGSSARFLRESCAVLVGGLIAGGFGAIWLVSSGAWGPFWDVALHWNPEYFSSRQNRWTVDRVAALYNWLHPWWWAHLVTLPIALKQLSQQFSRRHVTPTCGGRSRNLLAAFYLGWMLQTICLQHPLLYIHASGVLLALGIAVDAACRKFANHPMAGPLLASSLALLVVSSPATQPSRLAWWRACLQDGPTELVQDSLQQSQIVNHSQLEPALDFIRQQNVRDGELTVYSGYLVGVYRELDLAPSTRFVLLDVEARVFPSRVGEMASSLDQSHQRFVISNLIESGFPPSELGDGDSHSEPRLPHAFPASRLHEFPYNQQLVFRSGPYLVHEITSPVESLTTEYLPLAN